MHEYVKILACKLIHPVLFNMESHCSPHRL
jgi:hypothetical protein